MYLEPSLEKTLMMGKTEGRRRGVTEDEMVGWHHRLNGHEMSKRQGIVKDKDPWPAAFHGVAKSWT